MDNGENRGGLNFDGNDYVEIPRMNYNEVSVSAWFNKSTSGTNVIFGGFRYAANVQCQEGFDLCFHSSTPDILRFVVATRNASGTRTVKEAIKDFTDSNGIWYHVVGTYNKTTGDQMLYIDGQLADTQTHPSGNVIVPLTERNYMAIGTRYTDWGFFRGSIDDVRVYNLPLDAEEVQALLSKKVLIREGDEWPYFTGMQSPPDGWYKSGFDDSGWQRGSSGFGYGRDRNKTNLQDMQGNYSTVYVRRDFIVDDTRAVTDMKLFINCDGPFIAYLNGRQITSNPVGSYGEPLDVSGYRRTLSW
ncbi:MAG: LamG domain-containing protein [Planctomycetia bacterium]|nr:LamG domain-containing protein [Planctomycetia bacterium]